MVHTDEEARAIQQEIQGATGMLPQQKKPVANDQWSQYIGGMIDQQIQQNTPPSNIFAKKPATTTPMEPAKKVEPVKQVKPVEQIKPVERITQQPIASMDDLVNAMYTSKEQEDKMRKASVANQRIMAVADAIRHIGNIAHTVNYAPAQQFNDPVALEQARYERGKALRDKANLTYMSYQQQKAAQDAKMRQFEAEQAAKERQFQYNVAKDAATAQALKD